MAHITARVRPLTDDEEGIVGTRPRQASASVLDFGLFAKPQPTAPAPMAPRIQLCKSPADYAALSAFSRDGLALNELAARVANAILDVQLSVAVWEARIAMHAKGWLANDGKETLDGLGGLCTGMKLAAVDRERPPDWAIAILHKSHGNVNTVWVRPQHVASYDPALRRARAHAAPSHGDSAS